MLKYYTKACNFYYGDHSILMVKKKLSLPLHGNHKISFDTIELITRKKKKKIHISKLNLLSKVLKKKVQFDIKNITNPKDPKDNSKLEVLFEKMSKSKYNGVDPESVIKKYGADTARMFILFKAPPEKDLEWGDSDVEGQYRFLCRIWKLFSDYTNNHNFHGEDKLNQENENSLLKSINIAIKEISNDIKNNQFNTAISELMKFYNSISSNLNHVNKDLRREALMKFCILLAPFAPHISEEIWHLIGNSKSVHLEKWPVFDEDALKENSYELVIQINGKVRDKINVDNEISDDEIKEQTLIRPNVKKWIDKKTIRKIIIVKGRIINIVV